MSDTCPSAYYNQVTQAVQQVNQSESNLVASGFLQTLHDKVSLTAAANDEANQPLSFTNYQALTSDILLAIASQSLDAVKVDASLPARNIFSTVQWYRDQFLIGSDYADQRSVERPNEAVRHDERLQQFIGENQLTGNFRAGISFIPKSDPATAMGHPLLLSAGENYLRSIAAVDLLKPYATWSVSKNGPMFQTATWSMAQTIPLGQSSCDWAMRENLLWVLNDEEWKEFAKGITTNYVDRSYKDGS